MGDGVTMRRGDGAAAGAAGGRRTRQAEGAEEEEAAGRVPTSTTQAWEKRK